MAETDGAGLVRRLHQAFNDRDRDRMLACVTDDVRWHVPGDHPMAGSYRGRDRLWEDLLQPLWPSPARVEARDVIVHGDHVVALTDEIHDFGGGERAWKTVETFALADGRVTQRWAFTSGQAELDAFLTRGCAADPSVPAP